MPGLLRGDVEPHWLYVRWVRGVPWAGTKQNLHSYSLWTSILTIVIIASGGLAGYSSGAQELVFVIILGVAGFAFI
ncbi:MAG: hypothetical protein AAF653_02780, partial [Chloroflexota bacterium]